MDDPTAYVGGLIGVAVVYAWINPLFWVLLLVTLWRGWSLKRAAVLAGLGAVIWGVAMYWLQQYIASDTPIGRTFSGNPPWGVRVVVMVGLSMIWIGAIVYVARLLWRLSTTIVGQFSSAGRITYHKVRSTAPHMVEDMKGAYGFYVRTRSGGAENDDAFEIAGKELKVNRPIESLWAKALMLADGNSDKARSKYIKLRVDQIRKMQQKKVNQQKW
ncbi:MAG: hypothetical protein U5R46_15280 [Gammaproteobacteria bacterium]|nr:hypothetical protein [Gammaproteobacteria bacterium]